MEVWWWDDGVEGLELTSSHEKIKITTNCWTIINNKNIRTYQKKIFYIQRQGSHNKMLIGVISWKNQIPYPLGRWPTKLKIIILQTFPHRSEFWAPCQAPQPRGQPSGREGPRAFGFEVQQGLSSEAPQDCGKQRQHSWLVHLRFHVHWVPGQSSDYIGARARATCKFWRVPWGAGVGCGPLKVQWHCWQRSLENIP